jgi:hypothetical protein
MSTVGASHRGSSSWLPGRTLLLPAARATSVLPVIIWIRPSSQGNMTSNRMANLIPVFLYPASSDEKSPSDFVSFAFENRKEVLY